MLPERETLGRLFINGREHLFPEFQILFRRGGKLTYINLTAARQAVLLGSFLLVVASLVYFGARFQHFGHVVLSRGDALAQADRDRFALAQEIAALKDALAEAESRAAAIGEDNDKLAVNLSDAQRRIDGLEQERTHALADAQHRIEQLDAERAKLTADRAAIENKLANAEDKLKDRATNVAALSKELDRDREALRHSDTNQATLQSRVAQLEQQLQKANSSTDQYKNDLANIARKLQDLSSERDRLMSRQKIGSNDGHRPIDGGAVAIDVPPAPRERAVGEEPRGAAPEVAFNPPASAQIPALPRGSLETMLASAGLDVGKLLDEISTPAPPREGGPFVAAGTAVHANDGAREQQLQKLVAMLPLAAPLEAYRFESPFGARADPINHRRAYHTGVDLSAPYRTHVMSTAPGIVVFAGADGEYGRVVEIDHGHGIVTRYAHLHRTFVVKGQKVPAHFAVGELGSTGRSTGPHVHYEVVVDGTPLDPAKFIGAGKNVIPDGGLVTPVSNATPVK